MKIKIIASGNLKEKYLKEAFLEYKKRLGKFVEFEMIELKEENLGDRPSPAIIEASLKKEAGEILAKLAKSDYLIDLSLDGKSLSSPQLAEKIENITLEGFSSLAFVIGSSHGLHDLVRNRSNFSLSFSKLTFPHQLFRIMLMEQIYRAFKIISGEPYHK